MKFYTIFWLCTLSFVIGEFLQNYEPKQSIWTREIIDSIKRDNKFHQIMLITRDENRKMFPLICDFSKNLPILYFNYSIARTEKIFSHLEKTSSMINPRYTTLFVIVDKSSSLSANFQSTQEIMKFVEKLSTVKIRPKCLILQLPSKKEEMMKSNDEQFLQKMWKHLFLDVTIVKVLNENITIRTLNPFNRRGKMSRRRFSSKFPLFPDKLRNLYGYRMKIGIFHRPPYAVVERNFTKHPIRIFGPDAMTIKFFAEFMRFRLILPASEEEFFGRFSCLSGNSSGFLEQLLENRINLIGVTSIGTFFACPRETNEHLIVEQDHYVAVIPVQKSESFSLLFGRTFYYSILWTIGIIMSSMIIESLCHFDKQIWNFTTSCQLIFGISVPQQPRKLKERILFGFLLIVYFLYSAKTYTSLTEIYFHRQEEIKINTLRELSELNFDLAAEINFPLVIQSSGEENILRMLKRSNLTIILNDLCLKSLIQVKNRTCFVKKSLADWLVNVILDENGDSLIKIVPEYLKSGFNAFLLEPGSPYLEKFQKIFQLLVQSGIRNQMKREFMFQDRSKFLQKKTENDYERIMSKFVILGLLLVGFILSIFAFIGELLFAKLYAPRSIFE